MLAPDVELRLEVDDGGPKRDRTEVADALVSARGHGVDDLRLLAPTNLGLAVGIGRP